MIKLNAKLFARAAQKATTVNPQVTHNGAQYTVRRSNGQPARVKFTVRNGQIWASCNCPAGSPASQATPLPCYHIAAAVLLARRPAPPAEHRHQCFVCNTKSVFSCICDTPDEPDYDCDCVDMLAGEHRDSDYWQ